MAFIRGYTRHPHRFKYTNKHINSLSLSRTGRQIEHRNSLTHTHKDTQTYTRHTQRSTCTNKHRNSRSLSCTDRQMDFKQTWAAELTVSLYLFLSASLDEGSSSASALSGQVQYDPLTHTQTLQLFPIDPGVERWNEINNESWDSCSTKKILSYHHENFRYDIIQMEITAEVVWELQQLPISQNICAVQAHLVFLYLCPQGSHSYMHIYLSIYLSVYTHTHTQLPL